MKYVSLCFIAVCCNNLLKCGDEKSLLGERECLNVGIKANSIKVSPIKDENTPNENDSAYSSKNQSERKSISDLHSPSGECPEEENFKEVRKMETEFGFYKE